MKRISLLIGLFVILALPTAAQTNINSDLAQGFYSFNAYDVDGIASVNLNNGNLILHIPVISYPQRGQLPDLSFSVVYNGANWQLVSTSDGFGGKSFGWSWVGQGPFFMEDPFFNLFGESIAGKFDASVSYDYTGIVDSTGAAHGLGFVVGTNSDFRAVDDSG